MVLLKEMNKGMKFTDKEKLDIMNIIEEILERNCSIEISAANTYMCYYIHYRNFQKHFDIELIASAIFYDVPSFIEQLKYDMVRLPLDGKYP